MAAGGFPSHWGLKDVHEEARVGGTPDAVTDERPKLKTRAAALASRVEGREGCSLP